jgi:hypothetical protein
MDAYDLPAAAAGDYRLLLDRGYPVKATLKLVGDRYRLSSDMRTILFRGVLDSRKSNVIRGKLTADPPRDAPLWVDGYNVLLTMLSYLSGRPLFLATDGLVRDAAGLYGRIRHVHLFEQAVRVLTGFFHDRGFSSVMIYLDSPVSHSRDHSRLIEQTAEVCGAELQTALVRSSDAAILNHASGCCATSDSQIALTSRAAVWDLAAAVLREVWNFIPALDLETLLHSASSGTTEPFIQQEHLQNATE